MTAGQPTHGVVKVRWMRGMVTSALLPLADATQLVEDLHEKVVDCGDGYGFVHVTGYDGRKARIRGRDVVVIECVPDLPDRIRPAAGMAVPQGSSAVHTYPVGGTRAAVHDGSYAYPTHGVAPTAEQTEGGSIGGPGAASGTKWLQQQAAHGGPR